jgi:hypothetical protein
MILQFAAFGGMRPAVSDLLLPDNMASQAKDIVLSDGSIAPLRGNTLKEALGASVTAKTLYRANNGTFIAWDDAASVARIPIENNADDRILFTGTDQPRVTDSVKWPVSYYAGLPAPDLILEAAVNLAPPEGLHIQWDVGGTVSDTVGTRLARVYTYTYVTAWGEEGPPADPSKMIYVGDDDEVTLSHFSTVPSGPYQVTAVRIYRSTSGGEYLFVAEVPLPITTWEDTIPDTQLGDDLGTSLWSAPPVTLQHVVSLANGMLAGADGNTVRICEPYQGHAWPEDYKEPLDNEITGMVAAGNYVIVTTRGNPYYGVISAPDQRIFNKLETEQTIVSARSLVDTGDGAIYAAADGLVLVGAGGSSLLTRDIISEEYWRSLDPETIHGYLYKGQYIGFYDSGTLGQGGFIFDFSNKSIVQISTYCTAAHSDLAEGALYMLVGGDVYLFDDDSAARVQGEWTSKESATTPVTFSAAKVDAETYPVTFKLFAGGINKHTQVVANAQPFRLPTGYSGERWTCQVIGDAVVDGIIVAETMSEIR